MKLKCDTKKFRDCLVDDNERIKFGKYFSGTRNYKTMPNIEVSLPDRRTNEQNAAIWRDFGIVAKLLYCDPDYVYGMCLRAEILEDIWFCKMNNKWTFRRLSALNKEETSEAIPRIRDFLQSWIENEYQRPITIHWSSEENIEKPDFEF